ncbi:MAG: FadR/GntR family transcriptional regulator [Dehalococcoidia bacterium]
MLRAIKKTRLYEEIVTQIGELIRDGTLRPGDRVPPERELAERFKVSRASVREAIRALELQGLVVSRPGAGTFVASESLDGVIHTLAQELLAGREALGDTLELRLLLEPQVAALAAQRATEEDKSAMRAILEEQARLVEGGLSGAEADVAFHTALARSTQNRALVRLGGSLVDILALSRDESLQTPHRSRQSLESHQAILLAIEQGDTEGARQAMERHITSVDGALFDGEDAGWVREQVPQLGKGG